MRPAASRPGKSVAAFVAENHALAGINGGYFNHSDGWPVSHVTVAGRPITAPEDNKALTANKVLAPHLPVILNHRSEWRHVTTPNGPAWRITNHDAAGPVRDALQAGPRLLPQLDLEGEAFVLRGAHGQVTRDGIGAMGLATRSALGLKADGTLLLVGVGAPGLRLQDLATLMSSLGATEALNLDGGSSSSLVWGKNAFHGGHAPARVNSVLLVGP
ncbi:MAG: hypothetical protein JWM80_775 [Cyanobacteria bacterium RYN_339]|nr:hypothetical protein [Cyanobacteria bacterium RYN_339]